MSYGLSGSWWSENSLFIEPVPGDASMLFLHEDRAISLTYLNRRWHGKGGKLKSSHWFLKLRKHMKLRYSVIKVAQRLTAYLIKDLRIFSAEKISFARSLLCIFKKTFKPHLQFLWTVWKIGNNGIYYSRRLIAHKTFTVSNLIDN